MVLNLKDFDSEFINFMFVKDCTDAQLEPQLFKAEENNVGTVKQQLSKLFETSLKVTLPDEPTIAPVVKICTGKFGDYQWVKGKNIEFKGPPSIGQAIKKNLPESEMIESRSVAGPGFVNVTLQNKWIAKALIQQKGIGIWAQKLRVSRAVVDFSSTNIAKEMHVGHLRSTIIGDTIARLLEYSNVEVLRRNHVGDWGTQFGMLIEYLFEMFLLEYMARTIKNAGEQAIGDLQSFYRVSKLKFESDPIFKEKSQQGVVLLQGGDEKYVKAWSTICEISRQEFSQIYERLGVSLEEKGESFYKPYIPKVLEGLSKQGLIEENDRARVIFVEGKKKPLIVVKRDGAYNYASTDLTALWYRLNEEKADWIIYVTDAAKCAGWLPSDENSYPKTSHVSFGQVLGDDGKPFKTRSSDVVRLVDLLDEAKTRCKAELVERGKAADWTAEELEQTAETIGYAEVKYADLKNNRDTDYPFSYDRMLNDKVLNFFSFHSFHLNGESYHYERLDLLFAWLRWKYCYLQYTHARICSIIKKSNQDIEELKK
ncbi:hypothetical protein MKX03_004505, partial [Papaver bracteatum]